MRQLTTTPILAVAGLLIFTAGSLAMAPSAQAQGRNDGTVSVPTGACPSGWVADKTPRTCKSQSGSSTTPAIYVRANTQTQCAPGYGVDQYNATVCTTRQYVAGPTREQAMGKGVNFAKPNALARCPTGWISTTTGKECYTQLENAPIVRVKGAAACAVGELNDWGLWCTSNYKHLTQAEANRAGIEDFNKAYTFALGNRLDASSILDDTLSPAATTYFGGTASETTATASTSDSQPAADCKTGSKTGAAIGGAVAGNTGSAIGSALGGLGKKKKKTNGC